MFNNISEHILNRMKYLKEIDKRDRVGDMLEIGTSAGYSTLWLALVCGKQAG